MPETYRRRDDRMSFVPESVKGPDAFPVGTVIGSADWRKKAMKHCSVALLIVSSTTCLSPLADAHSEDRIDIGMLNPVEVSTTSIASDMSVVKNDFPLVAYRLPPVVHGPAYYPAWRDGVSRGSGRSKYLRGGRFFLHERDNDK